ncbi:MAG: hypothetical protein V4490_05640 [Pseudomonadota bacterium]
MNYRQQVLSELYEAWNFHDNAEQAANRVKNVMNRRDLKFKDAKDVDLNLFLPDISKVGEMFFDRVNSATYDHYVNFCWLCEELMDFEVVTRKMNDALYPLKREIVQMPGYTVQLISSPLQQRA